MSKLPMLAELTFGRRNNPIALISRMTLDLDTSALLYTGSSARY